MPESTRTFVAIAVPERLGRKLTDCQGMLAPGMPGCRWTSSLPFHATLVFLGDVRDSDLSRVCESVAASACGFEPIELALDGLGTFPSPERPRVIWAGLNDRTAGRLVDLQRAVVTAVRRAGYRPDDAERFHPHVTLGRIKPGRARPTDVTALLERHKRSISGSFTVTEVLTLSSSPGPAGPTYATLGRAPMKSEKVEPPS
jgi:2'-5' RNA ligase